VCGVCPYTDELAALRQAVAERDALLTERNAEIARLREERTALLGTQRNAALGPTRATALATIFEAAYQRQKAPPEPDGSIKVRLAAISQAAGVSPQRVSAHLDQLTEWGLLKKETRPEHTRRVDPSTGEIREHVTSAIYVQVPHLEEGVAAAVKPLPAFVRPPSDKPQWGGARPRCPDHPLAALVERREICCAQCGKVLDFKERPYASADVDEGPVAAETHPELWPTLEVPDEVALQDESPPGVAITSLGNQDERPWGEDDAPEAEPLPTESLHLTVLPGGREPASLQDWRAPLRRCVCGVGLPAGQVSCGNRFCREAVAIAGGSE